MSAAPWPGLAPCAASTARAPVTTPDDPPWLAEALGEANLRAARASGPGGQHVNKTSTAVELRFDAASSPSLPEAVRVRLARLAGGRMTAEGQLLLFAQEHRSQALNREAVLERLEALLRRAAVAPRPRRPTRPSLSARAERMADKARRGRVKAARTRPASED